MKKLIRSILTAVCLSACVGAFALGGSTKASADLTYTTMDELMDRMPECALVLEEAKIKNMTDWGYYTVDGVDVWYFYGDGAQAESPEIRFVTEGTQTVKKDPATNMYTFAPMEVESFSFSYRIDNVGEKGVLDIPTENYIVQILASDGTYPIITPTVQADGAWHTITVDENTPIMNSTHGYYYNNVDHLFCGFLFKMGGLKGELMISDIEIVVDGERVEPLNPYEEPETSEAPEAPETSEAPEEPATSETPEEPATSQTPEEPATSEAPEAPETSEAPSTSAPAGNEEPESSGCGSVLSGAYALTALAAMGFVMAVRKRK